MEQHQTDWPLAVPLDQNFVSLTLSTLVVGGIVIFVTAFLIGVWVGWRWQQGRMGE